MRHVAWLSNNVMIGVPEVTSCIPFITHLYYANFFHICSLFLKNIVPHFYVGGASAIRSSSLGSQPASTLARGGQGNNRAHCHYLSLTTCLLRLAAIAPFFLQKIFKGQCLFYLPCVYDWPISELILIFWQARLGLHQQS